MDWAVFARLVVMSFPDTKLVRVGAQGAEVTTAYMEHAQPHLESYCRGHEITLTSVAFIHQEGAKIRSVLDLCWRQSQALTVMK